MKKETETTYGLNRVSGIQRQIDRLAEIRIDLATAISNKGVSVSSDTTFDLMPSLIDQIEAASLDLEALDAMSELEDVLCGLAADTEGDFEIQKPYLRAYGYLQCIAECTEDDTRPLELYEWIYKRLFLRDQVDSYTVTVDGQEKNVKTVETKGETDYLAISVEQFDGITSENYYDDTDQGNDTLMHIFLRVIYDNPELLAIPSWMIRCEGVLSTTGEQYGKVLLLYVRLVPCETWQEMMTACYVARESVTDKVFGSCGINPGDTLTADQKSKVSKVIHDWLVVHNKIDATNGAELVDQTMYPALSQGANDPVCGSYAIAYQWIARLYGIESVAMTLYQSPYAHMVNLVNLNEPDGAYSERDSDWVIVDIYSDDMGQQAEEDCSWEYFQVPFAGKYDGFEIRHCAYASYPTENPTGSVTYGGHTLYEWPQLEVLE